MGGLEAETGGMRPQASGELRPAGNGQKQKNTEGASLEPSEGAWPCQALDFGLTASRR